LDTKEAIYLDIIIKFGNYFISVLVGVAWFSIRRYLKSIDCKFKDLKIQVEKEEHERKETGKVCEDNIKALNIDVMGSIKILDKLHNTNSTDIVRLQEQMDSVKKDIKRLDV
jgi:hypothetical protein